jgi:hypothetical protein
MKQLIFILLLPFLMAFDAPIASNDTKFCEGFEEGYKRGWCYNSYSLDYCTLTVVLPPCPYPRWNESKDSYTDGYDHGFSAALYIRQYQKTI